MASMFQTAHHILALFKDVEPIVTDLSESDDMKRFLAWSSMSRDHQPAANDGDPFYQSRFSIDLPDAFKANADSAVELINRACMRAGMNYHAGMKDGKVVMSFVNDDDSGTVVQRVPIAQLQETVRRIRDQLEANFEKHPEHGFILRNTDETDDLSLDTLIPLWAQDGGQPIPEVFFLLDDNTVVNEEANDAYNALHDNCDYDVAYLRVSSKTMEFFQQELDEGRTK